LLVEKDDESVKANIRTMTDTNWWHKLNWPF